MIRSSSILGNKLLMLRWIKCKHLDLKIFQSLKHCRLCCWVGPGFSLISPESNICKWKYEFKFLYLTLETIKSAIHSSNRKLKIITDIHELRRKKFWSGRSSHVIKEIWRVFVFKKQKSLTHQGKKKNFLPFYHFFVYTKPARTKK